MTIREAKELVYGDILFHKVLKNADGSPQRWKVNGRPQTWKRNPLRIRIPVKRGLYQYDYIEEDILDDFFV